MNTLRLLGLLALSLMFWGQFTACGAESRLIRLDDSMKIYGDTIRWGRIADAEKLVVNKGQLDPKQIEGVRITNYEIRDKSVSEDKKTATATVEIRYYNEEIGKERKVIDKQEWIYIEQQDIWMLSSDMPSFK